MHLPFLLQDHAVFGWGGVRGREGGIDKIGVFDVNRTGQGGARGQIFAWGERTND